MIGATLLLAHQGGWDEILLILTPIAIFAALLGLANRRANAVVRQRDGHRSTVADEPDPDRSPAVEDGEADPEPGPPSSPGGTSPPR